jgi:hypothetical protein
MDKAPSLSQTHLRSYQRQFFRQSAFRVVES